MKILRVCLKGIFTDNTLKEESSHENNFYDNYNSILVTHNILSTLQKEKKHFFFKRTYASRSITRDI